MTRRGRATGQRVVYLVSRYPALSHTFIEREVLALRALGVEVVTMSVRPADPRTLLSETMRDEARTAFVVLGSPAAILLAWLRTVVRRPRALLTALRKALRTGEPVLTRRVYQLFYLAEAVVVHDRMRRTGLRHLHVHFSNNAADIARLVVALGRACDGQDAGWRWTMTVHGPTEFAAEERFDLAAKVTSASGVACISDYTRSQLMRLTPPGRWSDLRLVHMSVDCEVFVPPPSRSTEGPLRVLDVGRLVPEKGAPVLLEAMRLLRERGCDVELRLVGEGPYEDQLRAEIERHGLGDRVQLVGPVGQDEIRGEYWAADVFCLPSFAEGLPVVLMEAMATELVPVTTRVAGIPELVCDGENGFVVSPGRADLVADRLEALAGSLTLRQELGRRARLDVREGFSVQVAGQAQLEFLRSSGLVA